MELYHHGILGQRWGVRRYQNPDGSYTEAGKKRYLNRITARQEKIGPYAKPTLDKKPSGAERRREEKLSRLSDDERRFRELKKKKPYEMTNQEMNDFNNRANLLQNYKRLNPSTVSKGLAIVASITGTMMVANKFFGAGKALSKNTEPIVAAVIDKLGDYVISDLSEGLKKPFT